MNELLDGLCLAISSLERNNSHSLDHELDVVAYVASVAVDKRFAAARHSIRAESDILVIFLEFHVNGQVGDRGHDEQ